MNYYNSSKILCIGPLVVDIINEPLNREVVPGEGVRTNIGIYPGGNSFNVAVDLVNMGIHGNSICCVGTAGDDIFLQMFRKEFEKYGIIPEIIVTSKAETSKVFVLQIKGKASTFFSDVGANIYMDIEKILKVEKEFIPDIIYIGGTGFLGDFEYYFNRVFKEAKKREAVTVFDTIISSGKDYEKIFSNGDLIDILHVNDIEAEYITGLTDITDMIRFFMDKGIGLVLISRAEEGVSFGFKEQYFKLPSFKEKNIDPTGAGDAFTAGIIKAFTELDGINLNEKFTNGDKKFLDAVVFAEASGACAVRCRGCTNGIKKEDIQHLIDMQKNDVLSGLESKRL